MSFESRVRAIVVEECGSDATQAYNIERGEVLMYRVQYGEEPDYRGIESAPYICHASPMAKYQPMLRLLDDSDLEILHLLKAEHSVQRLKRRQIYTDYVNALESEVEALLRKHAEGGIITLEKLEHECRYSRNCIKQLRRHAWRHKFNLDGVPEMVASTIRELATAMRFGEILVMPLPVPTPA